MTDLGKYRSWMRRRDASDNTIRQRLIFAEAWARRWKVWDVDADQIATWLAEWPSGWTRCTYYSHLRSLYSWLHEAGHVEVNPMTDVRRPRTPRPKPRPLTATEMERAIRAATGDLRTHLLLGQLEGLRAHEIAKIRGEDVTVEYVYVIGKGQRAAAVPTHPDIWRLAQTYPATWWFPSTVSASGHILADTVTQRVSRHFRALGITGSSHRNRHSFGTALMRSGANLRVVQELMRHSSLTTTAAYLGVDGNELTAAVGRLITAA